MKAYLVKRKEHLLLLFIVSIGIYFLVHNSFCNTPRTVLSKMPYKDKQCLEFFFKEILFDESLAYVVFGTKPMSLSLFSQTNSEAINDPHNQNIKNGWYTWKKYESQFSCPQFIFRTFGDLEKDDQIFIVLINKKNFISEFQQFPEESILLTQNNTIDKWLRDFETSPISFSECFHHNHVLKGIAFGFGKHNALPPENWTRE